MKKSFDKNDEVITATEAYFEDMDKFVCKYCIEKLGKLSNDCIVLECDYVDK